MRGTDETDTDKRLDSVVITELYCENCDKSITFYPDMDEIKFEHAEFF